jgi:hypothetical protein
VKKGWIYAPDLAAHLGISRQRAHEMLVGLEKTYGKRIVGRQGKRPYTTARALARVTPGLGEDYGLEPEIGSLKDRQTVTENRIDILARTVSQLRGEVRKLSKLVANHTKLQPSGKVSQRPKGGLNCEG